MAYRGSDGMGYIKSNNSKQFLQSLFHLIKSISMVKLFVLVIDTMWSILKFGNIIMKFQIHTLKYLVFIYTEE